MKMKLNILWLTSPVLMLFGCNDAPIMDIADEDMVPSQIYFVANNIDIDRVQTIDYLDIGDPTGFYKLALYKSGVQTNPATAKIAVLSAEELAEYNAEFEKNFTILAEDTYSIDKTELSFSGSYDDVNKLVGIEFDLEKLGVASQDAVLPLKISDATVDVSADKGILILRPRIVEVMIDFANAADDAKFTGDQSLKEDINLSLTTLIGLENNRWDVDLELMIDETYIEEYNARESTGYTLLPESMYSLETAKTILAGANSAEFKLSIAKEDVTESGYYMLPIRLKSSSQFTIDQTSLFVVYIDILSGQRLDRTGWTAPVSLCNTYEPAEAGATNQLLPRGYPEAVLDGDLASYWHSQWKPEKKVPPVYFVIDMQDEYIIEQVEMIQRQSYSSLKDVELYIGDDADELAGMETMTDPVAMQNHLAATETWRQIAEFQMQAIITPQVFNTTATSGRYLMVLITTSWRADFVTNLSEVSPFGAKL
jgi:hypothetical protein